MCPIHKAPRKDLRSPSRSNRPDQSQRGQDWGICWTQKYGKHLKHVVMGALFKRVVSVRENQTQVKEDIPKGTGLAWSSTIRGNFMKAEQGPSL